MNKNELKHILENNFLDILGKIFNYMSEELAQTNEQDTKALEKIDNKLKEKVELLKQEFNSIDENKKKSKNQAQSNKEQERMMKHKDEKNPYIAASLFATVVAIVLAMFPWNVVGSGIGTSLPMRIAIVVFALLADYHVTKAKQVNNLIFSKYGFRIKSNVVSMVNVLSVFVTIMGMFALFTY